MKKCICVVLTILVAICLFGCDDKNAHTNEAQIPLSNAYIEDLDYRDAVEQFKKAGFANVETLAIDDLITGWVNKDGEVEEITIAGKSDFSADDWVSKDAHVVIKYHTFPSNTDDVESDEESETATTITPDFDLEKAKRATVVAITNLCADDVFKSDGNTYDKSKFHSYSDLSGFYLIVNDWGTWTGIDQKTWHGENVLLEIFSTNLKINASADVVYNGKYYEVSDLEGDFGTNEDLSEMIHSYSNPALFLNVSPALVEKDRNKTEEKNNDKSDILDVYYAHQAFENYGKKLSPYGFKCHWLAGSISSEQDRKTGAWFFKVDVTITNEYGAKLDTVAEGRVVGTNENPKVKDFYIYN